MQNLKQVAKKLPFLPLIYRAVRKGYARHDLKPENMEDIFTAIYRHNTWEGEDSASGSGSDVGQTKTIIQELPNLFDEYNISTMMDIPCGDFHWMKNVVSDKMDYTGADIVEELIQKNREAYAREGRRFQ